MPSSDFYLVKDTAGALLIGALVTMAVYGITTLQAYYYYISFPNDGILTRALVLLLWVLDTIHVLFMCHSVHSYTIVEYGNPTAVQDGNWSLIASVLMNLLMIIIVQSFFTYRIFKLCRPSRRWWIGGCIAILVLCHAGWGLGTCVLFFIQRNFESFQKLRQAVVPFAVFDVVSDLSISTSLCLLLWGHRTGFEDTNLIINRLIVFLINRCILTCAVAIIESIIFVVFPHTLYVFAIDFVLGKLYVNSLLAVLNSRAILRPKTGEHGPVEMSTRIIICPRGGDDHLSVQVHKQVETTRSYGIVEKEQA